MTHKMTSAKEIQVHILFFKHVIPYTVSKGIYQFTKISMIAKEKSLLLAPTFLG